MPMNSTGTTAKNSARHPSSVSGPESSHCHARLHRSRSASARRRSGVRQSSCSGLGSSVSTSVRGTIELPPDGVSRTALSPRWSFWLDPVDPVKSDHLVALGLPAPLVLDALEHQ